jgi:Ser/Thr protein kinase RdoA (MazF antagonist)
MNGPADVRAHFARHLPPGSAWHLLPTAGLSGARLYRVGSAWVVKAHPLVAGLRERLEQIHAWQRSAQTHPDLADLVPVVCAPLFECAGHLWELLRWQPGTPSLEPTATQMRSAVHALARLHTLWSDARIFCPCPAILRRWAIAQRWLTTPYTAQRGSQVCDELAAVVVRHVPALVEQLRPWLTRSVAVQPCLVDVTPEHVLFTADRLTGIIDWSAAACDHPAVDLVRYLGGLSANTFATGMEAYAELRPLTERERELTIVLLRSNALLSAANWLMRLENDLRLATPVEQRLRTLLDQIQMWFVPGAHGSMGGN